MAWIPGPDCPVPTKPPTARPPVRPTSGFTILEAIVAVTIVGVAAVASLAAFGSQLRAGARAQVALEAEALAEEQLARLRLLPASSLEALPDSLRSGTFAQPFERYQWSSTVQPVAHEADIHEARVTVRWPDGEYSLATRLYRPLRASTR